MEVLARSGSPGGLGVGAVAGDTRDPNGRAVDIGTRGVHNPERGRAVHHHRVILGGGDRRPKLPIRVRKTLVTCQ